MSDHTTVLPDHQPQPEPKRSSRGIIAVVASVVVVVLVAAGGFAAWRFFAGGGPRPAEVLPASTFALVTVDLNPSGGQKVEAIKTLRKFPTFRDEVGLKPDSDPLKRIFEEVQKDGTCKDLDYDRDIKSWVGQRLGVGGVEIDDKPVPVAALQVSDADNARSGFARLAKCADDEGLRLDVDRRLHRDQRHHGARQGDRRLREAVPALGERRLPEVDRRGRWPRDHEHVPRPPGGRRGLQGPGPGPRWPDGRPGRRAGEEDLAKALTAYKGFQGAAASLRFADGGIELSAAGGGGKATQGKATVGDHVAAMPSDTALLLAIAIPPRAFDALGKSNASGSGSDLLGSMLGIDFPADLKTLLGKSISISLGGDAPADLDSIDGPGDLSLGALVNGDPDQIDAVIAKLEKSAGTTLSDLEVTKKSKDGKVAIASNEKYADQLLGKGSLSDDEGFKDAVPHAEDAQMVAYADFDGDWGKALLKTVRDGGNKDDAEIADNLEVLRALGASVWTDGDVTHGQLRLSLD